MVGLGRKSCSSRAIRGQLVLSLLAAPPKRAPPEVRDVVAEGGERAAVGRHGVIVEPSLHDRSQPLALHRDRLMHAPPQLLLDFHELAPYAVAPAGPVDQELAGARLAANEGEAQEVEGFRFAETPLLSLGRREAAKLQQPGLDWMQRQRELLEPFTHRVPEAPGVGLVLEPDDDVVGVPHDDHVALGLPLSPAVCPQIEHIVQVDVGQQRRYHRTLTRSPVASRHDSVF